MILGGAASPEHLDNAREPWHGAGLGSFGMGLGHGLGSDSEKSEPPTESFAGAMVSWEVSQAVTHPDKWLVACKIWREPNVSPCRAIASGKPELHIWSCCMEIVSLLCMKKLGTRQLTQKQMKLFMCLLVIGYREASVSPPMNEQLWMNSHLKELIVPNVFSLGRPRLTQPWSQLRVYETLPSLTYYLLEGRPGNGIWSKSLVAPPFLTSQQFCLLGSLVVSHH